ncbi:serine hydrolase [Lentzea guizhouensis]|uniref:Serine hydrolase n=1 Tax=Lentzea guizhouensis TaxID=1586287 RepID=A0A1B2HQM9_9PSEU|nr:serine hydrolase domain-containing protein [Lentzea guizhouensis]ANZ40029.1 serine hydrolase [Lentzea guizhouensis]
MKRFAAVVAGVALAVSVAPAHANTEVQQTLDGYLAQAGPGAAVHTGSGTYSTGTGKLYEQRRITAADHFRIGSQTKTFTAAVVLQLVDEQRVELDAPVNRYLPGVVSGNYNGDVITVRQLLQHTSGLVRDVRDARANPDGTYALAELVRSAMDEPAQNVPGAAQNYSNVGFLVLGMLIERLTGKQAGDAITERVITPLGLTETRFPAPGNRALKAPFLNGYLGGRVGPIFFWTEATTAVELSSWSTAGAMESTLDDLRRFYRALAAGQVVSPAALAEMRRTFGPAEGYGYGLALVRMPLSCGVVAWGHNGALTTGHYSFTLTTDDGRFAAVVTNTNWQGSGKPSAVDVADKAICTSQPR